MSLLQIPIHIFIRYTNCPKIVDIETIPIHRNKNIETHEIDILLSRIYIQDVIERPRLIILPLGPMYYNHIPRTSHVLLSVLGTCINYKAPATGRAIIFVLG